MRRARSTTACFDKRPLVVLMAEQVGDVIAAVGFAREHGLDLSVRVADIVGPDSGRTTMAWSSTCRRCAPCVWIQRTRLRAPVLGPARERGSVLGAAGRGWQLRRGDVAGVSPSRGRPGLYYGKIRDNYRQNYDRLVQSSGPTILATSST